MSNVIKDRIKNHFDRAYRTYDDYALVQKTVCQQALTLMLKYQNHFNVIADFACGTGESTKLLINNIQYRQGYALDFAKNLLDIAEKKSLVNVECVLSDFDCCVFDKGQLDLIFCNMGLQWSLDLSKTLSLLNGYLSQNGLLVCSLPIHGNFPEIHSEFRYALRSHEDVLQALNSAGFNLIESNIQYHEQLFSSYQSALKSLRYTGTNNPIVVNTHFKKMNSRDFFVESAVIPKLTYYIGTYICRVNSNHD